MAGVTNTPEISIFIELSAACNFDFLGRLLGLIDE